VQEKRDNKNNCTLAVKLGSGLPDFLAETYQNGKISKIAIKYTKWQQNIPNDNKIYQIAVK
jgi:hypothetical protein